MAAASTTAHLATAQRAASTHLFLPVYRVLLIVWAVLALLAPLRDLWISPDFLVLAVPAGLLLWFAWCARLRSYGRLSGAIEGWILLLVVCVSFILLSHLIGTLGSPYADAALAHADARLFPMFDWREDVIAFARSGTPLDLANIAYASPWWQATGLIVWLSATRRPERVGLFLIAWTSALIVTMCVFACVPAVGAYGYYEIGRELVPGVSSDIGWRQPVVLEALRTGSATTIGPGDLIGIIEFPSFHAAAAVIFAWAFWPIRLARLPMLALNIAMAADAVPIGGHYFVDILSGAIVGWSGILAAIVIARPRPEHQPLPRRPGAMRPQGRARDAEFASPSPPGHRINDQG